MRAVSDLDRVEAHCVWWEDTVSEGFEPWRFGVCSRRLSVLLPANASQSDRSTGFNFPASTANVRSLRNSS